MQSSWSLQSSVNSVLILLVNIHPFQFIKGQNSDVEKGNGLISINQKTIQQMPDKADYPGAESTEHRAQSRGGWLLSGET